MSASGETLDLITMADANPRYSPLTSITILVESIAENITYSGRKVDTDHKFPISSL
jgi:hypothetical protein